MAKFCESCGAEMDETARFCESCGAKAAAADARQVESRPDVRQAAPETERKGDFAPDATGKYHWYYELDMFKDPTVFITCFKVFTLVVGIMSVIMFFILLGDGFMEAVLFFFKFFILGVCGMTVLLALGYVAYAAIQGGKYCVVFEMDGDSVTHTQLAKQFKRAQVVAGLAALIGASRGSLTMTGTGLLAGSRSSMSTHFRSVRAIRVKRRRGVIYLNSATGANQVYAEPEIFDAVLNYILPRIPDNAKREGC